jgi:hypothetical protein
MAENDAAFEKARFHLLKNKPFYISSNTQIFELQAKIIALSLTPQPDLKGN